MSTPGSSDETSLNFPPVMPLVAPPVLRGCPGTKRLDAEGEDVQSAPGGGFPLLGDTQNAWFLQEKTIEMDEK